VAIADLAQTALMLSTPPSQPGPIALVGSGEFLPQMREVDVWMLRGRRQRVAFLPTAAGEEGPRSVNRWVQMGHDHYATLGVESIAVPVLNSADANNPEMVELLADVGLIYLSGGNPGYIAGVLTNSLVGNAIVEYWRSGGALAGCSAGAMALTGETPAGRTPKTPGAVAAMNVVSHLTVIPHFDQMEKWNPGFLGRAQDALRTGTTLVGIDEDTALVGGQTNWQVMGRLGVTVFSGSKAIRYENGQTVLFSPELSTDGASW
jgi:cyanophycinase